MNPYWYRLAIDLDRTLGPIGSYWELRTDTGPHAVHVMTEPGPFDAPEDVLRMLVAEVTNRHGVQLPLL